MINKAYHFKSRMATAICAIFQHFSQSFKTSKIPNPYNKKLYGQKLYRGFKSHPLRFVTLLPRLAGCCSGAATTPLTFALSSILPPPQKYFMPKLNRCKTKTGLVNTLRSGLTAILGIMLLLALTAQIPMALAGETNEEYRERRNREWYREQEFKRELDQIHQNYRAPSYHAIAFSKSTSRWGCAYGKSNRAIAEREALRECRAPDAKVLCWAEGSWYCALADGPKSYGGASAETAAKAKAKALKFGNDVAPGCRIILLVGGDPPIVREFK